MLKGFRKMKRSGFLWAAGFLFLSTAAMGSLPAHAEDFATAREKAKEYHDIASSDIIYVQEEMKALYYQNLQIIELLGEIRDLLQQKLAAEKA